MGSLDDREEDRHTAAHLRLIHSHKCRLVSAVAQKLPPEADQNHSKTVPPLLHILNFHTEDDVENRRMIPAMMEQF